MKRSSSAPYFICTPIRELSSTGCVVVVGAGSVRASASSGERGCGDAGSRGRTGRSVISRGVLEPRHAPRPTHHAAGGVGRPRCGACVRGGQRSTAETPRKRRRRRCVQCRAARRGAAGRLGAPVTRRQLELCGRRVGRATQRKNGFCPQSATRTFSPPPCAPTRRPPSAPPPVPPGSPPVELVQWICCVCALPHSLDRDDILVLLSRSARSARRQVPRVLNRLLMALLSRNYREMPV